MPPAGALKDQDQRRSASKISENKEEWLTNWLLQRQPQVTPPPGAPNGSKPNFMGEAEQFPSGMDQSQDVTPDQERQPVSVLFRSVALNLFLAVYP